MKVIITGRNIQLTDSFKSLVEKKIDRFDRMFKENASAQITVTAEKNRHKVEITISNNGMFFRAEDTSLDMNESLDKVMASLSRQFRKNKTKLEKKLKSGSIADVIPSLDGEKIEEELEYQLVRTKHFSVKPMTVDEAILEMNMVGHNFYIFKNADNNSFNVVYIRKDGKYGLLIPKDMQKKGAFRLLFQITDN